MTDHRGRLRDDAFIRHRLHSGSGSSWQRYASLVLAHPTLFGMIRYELLTTLFGSLPGALGIVLRKVLYPYLFPKIGRGVVFGARVTIRHPERIVLGDGVVVDDDAFLDGRGAGDEGLVIGDRAIVNRSAYVQAKVGMISIGADTNIGAGVRIISQGPIRIGDDVSIAGGCVVAGGRYVVERDGEDDRKERFTGGEIHIGKGVRLAMNVIIQDGVTVGEGAIVAPGSVVVSDVEAHVVVSGFPARPWRERKVRAEPSPEALTLPTSDSTGDEGTNSAIIEKIKQWLEEHRFAEFTGPDALSHDESLFDADILDSLSVVSMVTWLEQTFDISIADDDLIPENLETVTNIERFVLLRQGALSS
ncbi:MAG: DapH/DapD/GlmU-related protein [Pseudomonadota bacterium]